MKRKIGILYAMIILIGIPIAAKAAGTADAEGITSYGSIVYKDETGAVGIYAEDIVLLHEKLASVSDEIFAPILYSHPHAWEYIDINEKEHTKHCDGCGSKYDVTDHHNATEKREYTISFDGQDFAGYEYVCECGHCWIKEEFHTAVYIEKDENVHSVSCMLAGTPYCKGTISGELEHILVAHPIDASHHQKICNLCDYEGLTEVCIFNKEDAVTNEGLAETRKYCECGNYITEPTAGMAGMNVTEMEEADAENASEETAQDKLEESEETEETEEKAAISESVEEHEKSVSGNDCVADEMTAEEIIREEGKKNEE